MRRFWMAACLGLCVACSGSDEGDAATGGGTTDGADGADGADGTAGGDGADGADGSDGTDGTSDPCDGLDLGPLPTAPGTDELLDYEWMCEARRIYLTLPEGFDPASGAPIVFVQHGAGGAARDFRNSHDGFVRAAHERGWMVVFTEGTPDPRGDAGHIWNPWDLTSDSADDVGLLSALIGRFQEELGADPSRTFMVGFSMGAAMTQRFAAERPDEVVALAAVAHSVFRLAPPDEGTPLCACDTFCDPEGCPIAVEPVRSELPTPAAPVPIFLVRGGNDERICPHGGCSDRNLSHSTAEEQLSYWISANRCDPTDFAETTPFSGATFRVFTDCPGGAPVVHSMDNPMGHFWKAEYYAPFLEFFDTVAGG